jgi:hypothetical protein
MVRTVNEAAHQARRNTILDAAERAIETKGYGQMAIADSVSELHISLGAFYHIKRLRKLRVFRAERNERSLLGVVGGVKHVFVHQSLSS